MTSAPMALEGISSRSCERMPASTSVASCSIASRETGRFWQAFSSPPISLRRSNGSRRPSFFSTLMPTSSTRS